MQTKDMVQGNVEKIGWLFPNCVTESKDSNGNLIHLIDFEALKRQLSDVIIEEGKERYIFTWPGKSAAQHLANTPSNYTLRPCKKESVNYDSTGNIYIEGDNLEVLKLLRETYLGKIKLIYIDPPYNTGNDFVYSDKYDISDSDYAKISGDYDSEGNRLVINSTSNGRFHSDWLNMIYPRLVIAKDLLSIDGAIFISIDDHECANLKKICDEIFGERKFVADISWQKTYSPKNNSTGIPSEVEHIIVYSASENWTPNRLPRTEEMNSLFSNPDHDVSEWMSDNAFAPGAITHQGMVYAVQSPFTGDLIYPTKGRCWCREQSIVFEEINKWASYKLEELDDADMRAEVCGIDPSAVRSGVKSIVLNESLEDAKKHASELLNKGPWPLFYFTKGGFGGIRRKTYLNNLDGKMVTNLWPFSEVGHNDEAKKELKAIFDSVAPFDTPKPTRLIEQMIKIATDKDSIVLDFFSGSATTANAVMKQNKEDSGRRRYILVQVPEKCDSAKYPNICEIGKERIRRIGKTIADSNKQQRLDYSGKVDVGFRVLKLDSSNMNDVFYNPQSLKKDLLDYAATNIKLNRTSEDLLFQVMLELGIELSSTILNKKIAGKEVFVVDGGYLVACFDEDVTDEVVIEIARNKPTHVVFRDSSMANDSVAINFEQIFKAYSPNTKTRVL